MAAGAVSGEQDPCVVEPSHGGGEAAGTEVVSGSGGYQRFPAIRSRHIDGSFGAGTGGAVIRVNDHAVDIDSGAQE